MVNTATAGSGYLLAGE